MVDGFDVSGLDTPWDDDEEDFTSPSVAQSQRRQTACPGHERALPVDDIVKLLDMKEEGKVGTLQYSSTVRCTLSASLSFGTQSASLLEVLCVLFQTTIKACTDAR